MNEKRLCNIIGGRTSLYCCVCRNSAYVQEKGLHLRFHSVKKLTKLNLYQYNIDVHY